MPSNTPFLVQMCDRTRETPPLPLLTVGSDGLLRRTTSERPLIDEINDDDDTSELWLSTIVTRIFDETPDPDVIRAKGFFDSTITDVAKIAPDPDLTRITPYSFLATTYTNGKTDRPDPDILRR